MQEWKAVFLDTPRLCEAVNVLFRGQKCQTSHISTIEVIDGTNPVEYRVKTMSGGVYVGPVGTEFGPLDLDSDDMDPGTYS